MGEIYLLKLSLTYARLELETFNVLDWRDNQLHHGTLLLYLNANTPRPSVLLFYFKKISQETVRQ